MSNKIAIVGLACRFPGAPNVDAFWANLCDGVESIAPLSQAELAASGVPRSTYDHPLYVSRAPTLENIEWFDASFFGYSPREAGLTDPQHRIFLELAWEALESAGYARTTHAQHVGVFAGSGSVVASYLIAEIKIDPREKETIATLEHLGNDKDFLATRVSYKLNLTGPSLAVQTACSTSLVALHLACQSLLLGECDMALAGAVAVRVPHRRGYLFVEGGILAPDGRCRPFDTNARGTIFGSGAGVVALKRLEDALADGDFIRAVICGSAINNDGSRKVSYTASSGEGVSRAVAEALTVSEISPDTVDLVEAHGTATSLGDPVEVAALTRAFRRGTTRRNYCWLGSVKGNIGHLDMAAGMAGLIKTVLALQHHQIPPTLHVETPNPKLHLDTSPFRLATALTPWPAPANHPRRAGVSALGIGGTNAHVVLEEAPARGATTAPANVRRAQTTLVDSARPADLLVMSARSDGALREGALRLAKHLEERVGDEVSDVAFSLATTRMHHEMRMCLTAGSREEAIEGLKACGRGESPRGVARGSLGTRQGKLAWLFTGQGAQTLGMGRGLYDEWPVFREALDKVLEALKGELPRPLQEVMWAESGTELNETGWAQPALFAVEVALAALWRSWGVKPDYVTGHSIGELSAAHVAGVMSLEDAARLVAARGRLMQSLPRGGAMVAVRVSEETMLAALQPYGQRVSLGAVNGPESVVVSGEEGAVLAIAEGFAARGVRTKRLAVSHAFHSPMMDPMLEEFRRVAEGVRYGKAEVAVVSNVSGRIAGEEIGTAEYWVRHVREAVRFGAGIGALGELGVRRFLELGPKATLVGLVPSCLPEGKQEQAQVWSSLREERSEVEAVLDAVGGYHADGGAVEWPGLFPKGGRRVELPTYAWQRERHWVEGMARGRGGEPTGHPLLGVRVSMAGASAVYESVLSLKEQVWLGDHRVGERPWVPGAAVVEILRAAGEQHYGGETVEVTSVVLQAPLVLPETGGQRVQVVIEKEGEGGGLRASVYSHGVESSASDAWTTHATALVGVVRSSSSPKVVNLDEARARCAHVVAVGEAYEKFSEVGLNYGRAFRGIKRLERGTSEALAELVLPSEAGGTEAFGVHPALLDAAFQAAFQASIELRGMLFVPFSMARLVVHVPCAKQATAYVRWVDDGEGIVVDVTLADAQGRVLVEVEGLQGRRGMKALDETATTTNAVFRVGWSVGSELGESALPSGRWVVVASEGDPLADALEEELQRRDRTCVRVKLTERLGEALPAEQVVWLCPVVGGEREEETRVEAALNLARAGLGMVQLSSKQTPPPQLTWVTRGAMAVKPEDAPVVASSAVWGLGRTVTQEHPELGCKRIDLEGSVALSATRVAEELVRELGAADDETDVAWRGGERHVARLVRAEAPVEASPRSLRTDGTVVITGGLGALGVHAARWLIGRGVRDLVLSGRRGKETPGASEVVAELEALGARVRVEAVDVSKREEVAGLLGRLPADRPLRGVVHTAGVLEDGMLTGQSEERFARVMGPKVGGACHLDELTRGADLDLFVMYSSISGTTGAAGQSGYAAANVCLDALASLRRSRGLVGQSLAWGPWAEGGLAAALDPAQKTRLERAGYRWITASQGTALLDAAWRQAEAELVVAPLDLRAVSKSFQEVPPLWRALVRSRPEAAAAASPSRGGWSEELEALSPERRLEAVREVVRAELARILSFAGPDAVAIDRPLLQLGLDSLTAIELRNALGKRVGISLPATLAFDHPTVEAIAKYILIRLEPDARGAPEKLLQDRIDPSPARGANELGSDVVTMTALSSNQERLYFFNRLLPDSALYHLWFGIRIEGPVDVDLLRASLTRIVERHAPLRTVFHEVQGRPYAIAMEAGPAVLQLVDLRHEGADRRVAALAEVSFRHASTRFDLTRGPLWRATLVTFADGEHVLLVAAHHIITDALSLDNFASELVKFYRGGGKSETIAPLSMQFADYARRQRRSLLTKEHQRSLGWWREQLADLPRLDLPYDRRPAIAAYAGDACSLTLSSETAEGLRALARREGCTLFHTLAAAWMTLLARYSGQPQFPLGILSAGRGDDNDQRDIIGFFINTLVVRSDVSGAPTFVELMHRTRDTIVRSLANENVPLDEVVRAIGTTRDAADLNPLFQAAFHLEPRLRELGSPPAAKWSWLPAERVDGGVPGTAKFDICLAVAETGSSLRATIEYAMDRFDRRTIERMLTHLDVLVASVVRTPEVAVDQIGLLTAAERQRILVEWNVTTAEIPNQSVVELFTCQADLRPDAVAVVSTGRPALTYGELDRRSNQVARHLQALGVGPGSLVGVYLDRSLELIVGLLGISKAGGAYVPLDTSYPDDRLRYMVEDCGTKVLLTTQDLVESLPSRSVQVVLLDRSFSESEDRVTSQATANDLAYVIYTSGSTGKPKGVNVLHHGLTNLLAHFVSELEFTQDDVVLAVTSISFDIAALELWMPLVKGAKVHLMSRMEAVDGALLARRVGDATTMQATPATWHLMIDAGWRRAGPLKVLCGGEPMSWDLATKLADRATSVLNVYGPTETTIWSTSWAVHLGRGSVCLGRGIANTQIYVLDRHLEPVPIGVAGEVFIAGDGLARGYLGRDALTEEKFIQNPYTPGTRMYRTGDVGRWGADGNLEYVARVDHQVKVRGFRIELGEIETTLLSHAAVRNAVVVVKGSGADARLIGFVVGDATAKELSDHLRGFLPDYMVPSTIVKIDALPLLPNGKVDRGGLSKMQDLGSATIGVAPSPAHTTLEIELTKVWGHVLGVATDTIDVTRSFFEQGGTSLQFVRLQSKIREALSLELSILDLFGHPTVRALAEHVERRGLIAPSKSHAVTERTAGSSRPSPVSASGGGDVLSSMLEDSRLPESIEFRSADMRRSHIVVTGANGFLGAHVAHAIVAAGGRVVAVVRAEDTARAQERFADAQQRYKLSSTPGIEVFPLSRSKPDLQALLRDADTVIHCAASHHHVFGYREMRDDNVAVFRELLIQCARFDVPRVHYVSSSAAFLAESGSVQEWALPLAVPETIKGGYVQTKWVGEHLVADARRRGLNVTSWRLPWICGAKGVGVPTPNDAMSLFLSAASTLKVLPRLPSTTCQDLVPVDFVASSLARLVLDRTTPMHAMHFGFSSTKLTQETLSEILGVREIVDEEQWHARLALTDHPFRMYPWLPFPPLPRFVSNHTNALLAPPASFYEELVATAHAAQTGA